MGKQQSYEKRVLDRCKLRAALQKDGSWTWELDILGYRGATSRTLQLPAGLLQERDVTEQTLAAGLPAGEGGLRLEKAIRAIVSIAVRPSDYGISQAQLDEARAKGAAAVVNLISPGRTYARGRVELSYIDIVQLATMVMFNADQAPSQARLPEALVLAAAAAGGSTEALQLRVSGALLDRIKADAQATNTSPGLAAKRALEQHYGVSG